MPDTNPLGGLVRALEEEAAVTRAGRCPVCGVLVVECDERGDCRGSRKRKALAAFKAWRPWRDAGAVEAVAHGTPVAALKALWEHLGLTTKDTP